MTYIDIKQRHLGSFDTELEAHQAYLQALNSLSAT